MAINDGLYWHKNVLKKQLKLASRIYLSIAIVLAPIFLMSSANAAVGGWDLKNPVVQGASTVYDATKNVLINGKKYIKESSVKITPTATSVAKVLARGGAGYALSVAVEQLLGSVDWILDAENNQVRYRTEPTECQYKYPYQGQSYCLDQLGQAANKYYKGLGVQNPNCSASAPSIGSTAYINCSGLGGTVGSSTPTLNLDYSESAEDQYPKSISLNTVAAQVISNAESDSDKRAAAQVATSAAAADIVAEAEKDEAKARPIASQAEANATTKPADAAEAEKANEAQGQTKPNEANPEATDISLEFPVFCSWAPTVCEAAQVVISFPNTLTGWWETAKSKSEEWALSISEAWTAAKEWASSEPEKEDSTELEFEELDLGADEVNLSGSNTCPQDSVSFSVMGQSVTLDMPYQPVCDALNFFKPAVLLVGAVASVYIVAGVRTKEEDEV